MRNNKITYALGLLPLLMGADGVSSNSANLTVNQLPTCAADQVLGYQSGGIACVSLKAPGGLPNCDSKGQLLTSRQNGDVNALACIDKGKGSVTDADVTRVTDIETSLTKVGDIITQIKANPPASVSIYVGSTTTTTKGRIEKAGVDTGLNAAHSLCDDAFKGSHMCTAYEMYATAVAGKLKMGDKVDPAWVWMPSWNEPNGTPEGPSEGTSDNCGSHTYPTGDKKWTGIAVQWTTLSTGAAGFKFLGGSKAPCNQPLPIACCK